MELNLRQRLLQRAFLAYGRFSRGMTLGVRGLLLRDGVVVLVRHRYVPGWYLPGGGVEAGECLAGALAREVREEAGASLSQPAELFGVYRHQAAGGRDHVALFVCREWVEAPAPRRGLEIAEIGRFPVDALPEGATEATRRRIAEVLGGSAPAIDW